MRGLTDLQKAVKHQVQRINRLIRSYKKQGFQNVPEEFTFDKSKARTLQLERLEKIGRKSLLKKSTYSGVETGGENIPASEVTKVRRIYNKAERQRLDREYEENLQDRQYNEISLDQDDIPDFSNIWEVRDRIANLPIKRYVMRIDGSRGNMDLSSDKSLLVSEFDNAIDTSKENLIELDNYLGSHSIEITSYTDIWTYDSKEESVRSAVSNLFIVIARRPITIEEQEQLNNQYEEDDFEEFEVDFDEFL